MTPVPRPDRPRRSRELLSEAARRRLRAAILDGTLTPGERLHDDELILWLGVSRTPIRTALERLAEVGLVEMEPNRFTRVARPTVVCLHDALAVYASLHVMAAETSGYRMTPRDIAELERCVAEMTGRAAEASDDVWGLDAVRAADAVFGFAASRAGNPVLVSMLREIETRLLFYVRSLPVPIDREAIDDFAGLVVTAYRAGDGAAVAAAIDACLGRLSKGVGAAT